MFHLLSVWGGLEVLGDLVGQRKVQGLNLALPRARIDRERALVYCAHTRRGSRSPLDFLTEA